MHFSRRAVAELAIATGAASASTVTAQLTQYYDRIRWEGAAGPTITGDFTDIANGTPIQEQYSEFGASFAADTVAVSSGVFLDLFGAKCFNDYTTVQFSPPNHAIAFEFPHELYFRLYSGTTYLGSGGNVGGGLGMFHGVTSIVAFDRVQILNSQGFYSLIDNISWGIIPSPAGVTLLTGTIALAAIPRRRR